MDDKDVKILEMLKENAKLRTQQIAKKTLIPITTVHNRIKKMERDGIIKGYTTILDHKKLGKSILAFVLVKIKHSIKTGDRIAELMKAIKKFDGVEDVFAVTGGTDVILKIRVEGTDKLNDFVITNLRNMEGVDSTITSIVLSGI